MKINKENKVLLLAKQIEDAFSQKQFQLEFRLKKFWKIANLEFIGTYEKSITEKSFGYITNIRTNDKTILYPRGINDRKVSIRISAKPEYIVGGSYKIKAKIADLELRKLKGNPYLLICKKDEIIKVEEQLAPKEFIKEWFFKKGENPGDASTIASQLKLNELELYTKTERFVFELLQNADDMPLGVKGVDVKFEMIKDHFLFLHNGKFFDRNDVQAISDAAKSTKTKDDTKTGYKGIGFKSVFTDSTKVYIKSGDYSFKFDKLDPIYSDFWKLYNGYFLDSSKAKQEKFKKEYVGREAEFTNIERIPWQIKPIWFDYYNIPGDLKNSDFSSPYNVAIALEIGEETLSNKEYDYKVKNLFREPRFLLFLRNLNKLEYSYKNENINYAIDRKKSFLEIKKDNIGIAKFIKSEYEIKINNESFKASGLNFEKREIEDGKYEFIDSSGIKIENIPEKLSILNGTTISFAAEINEKGIINIENDKAILFNYLPTSDTRFEFPFLVNGDFVTKTDREFILHENIWNQYLFYQIGFYNVLWVEHLIGFKNLRKTYLNVLVNSLKNEEDEALKKINIAFNQGYIFGIQTRKFILNDLEEKVGKESIIIDESGISKIFGNDLVYKLCGTEKRLPHKDLPLKVIKLDIFQIERYTTDQFLEDLEVLFSSQDSNKIKLKDEFLNSILKLNDNKYRALLEWVDKKMENGNSSILTMFPFIRSENKIETLETFMSYENSWFKTTEEIEIIKILKTLEFKFAEFEINLFQNIKNQINKKATYLNDDLKKYERIISSKKIATLIPTQKIELLLFLENLNNIDLKKLSAETPLFVSTIGQAKALKFLIEPSIQYSLDTLESFAIKQEEYELLPDRFKKSLISENRIFEDFFLNVSLYDEWSEQFSLSNINQHIEAISYWFNKVENTDDISQSQWDSVAWIYINDEDKFQKLSAVYCPTSFYNLPEDSYLSITNILKDNKLSTPCYKSISILETLNIKAQDFKITSKIKPLNNFSLKSANLFLDWLEANNESNFLHIWSLNKVNEDCFNFIESKLFKYNSKRIEAHNYIQNKEELRKLFQPFPSELSSASRSKIGLFQGDELILKLIESKKYTQDLAIFISNDFPVENFKKFILNLPSFQLSSVTIYDNKSPEHTIINRLLNFIKEDVNQGEIDQLFNIFREKIFIDDKSINNFNKSDKISFKIENEIYDKLKLSDVLIDFKGESDVLTEVVNAFKDIKAKDSLSKKIFSSIPMDKNEIFGKIKSESSLYLSPHQTVFMHLFNANRTTKVLFPKESFSNFLFKNNRSSELPLLYITYINILYDLNFSSETIIFYPKKLNQLVLSELKIDDETIPKWLNNWINQDSTRLTFCSKLGLNIESSSIVELRKAIIKEPYDIDEVNKFYAISKSNSDLLWNTVLWMKSFSDEIITKNIDLISKIYTYAIPSSPDKRLIPFVSICDENKKYSLVQESPNKIFHIESLNWGEYSRDIYQALTRANINNYIIDAKCPIKLRASLNSLNQKPIIYHDSTFLNANSQIFNELYYRKWKHYNDYPIYIYIGENLPKIVKYGDLIVKKLVYDKSAKVNDKFYITKDLENNILNNLPNSFPKSIKEDLINWKLETESNPDLLSGLEYGYNETVERILRDRLGLNSKDQRSVNQEAKAAVLYQLQKENYDISNVQDLGAKLSKIKDANGIEVEYIVRSAIGGLLYIEYFHWNELKKENTSLAVIFPNSDSPQFFHSNQELLNEELNEYILFRIHNSRNIEEIDKIFNQLDSNNSHLMMVTSEKMKKSLFQKLIDSKNKPSLKNIAVEPNFDLND